MRHDMDGPTHEVDEKSPTTANSDASLDPIGPTGRILEQVDERARRDLAEKRDGDRSRVLMAMLGLVLAQQTRDRQFVYRVVA